MELAQLGSLTVLNLSTNALTGKRVSRYLLATCCGSRVPVILWYASSSHEATRALTPVPKPCPSDQHQNGERARTGRRVNAVQRCMFFHAGRLCSSSFVVDAVAVFLFWDFALSLLLLGDHEGSINSFPTAVPTTLKNRNGLLALRQVPSRWSYAP